MRAAMILALAAATAILAAGCSNFVTAEKTVNTETKVYGFDGSLPIPGFSGAENIVNMRFGAIVTRYQSMPKDSQNQPYGETEYQDISLWSLSGGGKSIMSIGLAFPSASTQTDSEAK